VSFDGHGARSFVASRRSSRGEGHLKAVIYTAILAFAVYSGVKLVPPYVAEYQLADKIEEQARFAVVNRYSEDRIREDIFKVIQDLSIPAKREDIKIVANPAVVKISVDYTVPVDLLFFKVNLHFTPSSENKSIM